MIIKEKKNTNNQSNIAKCWKTILISNIEKQSYQFKLNNEEIFDEIFFQFKFRRTKQRERNQNQI